MKIKAIKNINLQLNLVAIPRFTEFGIEFRTNKIVTIPLDSSILIDSLGSIFSGSDQLHLATPSDVVRELKVKAEEIIINPGETVFPTFYMKAIGNVQVVMPEDTLVGFVPNPSGKGEKVEDNREQELLSMKVPEIKELAKEQEIEGFNQMKKADLVAAIILHEETVNSKESKE